jgi:ribonuclease HII
MKKRHMIIGIDEVGRGALAGPVCVAALVMPRGLYLRKKKLAKLKDSKKLSPKQREEWVEYLENHPKISYAVASVSPGVVDKRNVTKAANIAATRALAQLVTNNRQITVRARVYLDGGLYVNKKPETRNYKSRTLVRGDEKINAIKLASIVAKVKRDNYMVKLHEKHPEYAFHDHKGYGTKKHLRRIKKHGVSPVHRLTFI